MPDLAENIRQMLARDDVSFAELARIDGFNGDFTLCVPGNEKIVIWADMSEEAIDCLDELRKQKFYHYHSADTIVGGLPLVYLMDGARLDLPLVRSQRAYKKLHWFPVIFKLGPKCSKRPCPMLEPDRARRPRP